MSRARDNANLGAQAGSGLDASDITTGALPVGVTGGSGLNALSASNLSAGTVPDARFPATLPATSGVNLTAINATNLGSGTVPDARFPATLPAASGANLTALPAANLTGTITSGTQDAITRLGTVTAGTLSTSVVNNINMIGFHGELSGSTTITGNGIILCNTNVVINGMTIDGDEVHVVTAGKYLVMGQAYTQGTTNASHYARIEIRKDGSNISDSGAVGYTTTAARHSISTHIIHDFSVGEEITLYALISGDSIYGGTGTRLSILYLGK